MPPPYAHSHTHTNARTHTRPPHILCDPRGESAHTAQLLRGGLGFPAAERWSVPYVNVSTAPNPGKPRPIAQSHPSTLLHGGRLRTCCEGNGPEHALGQQAALLCAARTCAPRWMHMPSLKHEHSRACRRGCKKHRAAAQGGKRRPWAARPRASPPAVGGST